MKYVHTLSALSALSACLALSACGGGGGGSAPMTPTATDVTISSSNQSQVARSAVSGGIALALAQPLDAPGHATALASVASTGPHAPLPVYALATITQRAVRHAPSPTARRMQPLAVSSETENCTNGGSVVSTFDDRDDDGDVSAGDRLSIVFANCAEADGSEINGSVVLQVDAVTVNSETELDLKGSFDFDKVNARLGATTATLDGSLAATVAMNDASLRLAFTVGAGGLRIDARAPGLTENLIYEQGMRVSIEETYTGSTKTSFAIDGAFSSDSLGGRLTIATVSPFRMDESTTYPVSGQMIASGAAGSRLRVTAPNASDLRLELDADGNGTFESTQVIGWSTIVPL